MSDVEDRSEFIRLNLSELTKKTTLNLELVTLLYSGGLITSSEEEYLMHHKDGDSRKIFHFYTVTARKWDDHQFKKFIEILQQLGHLGAYEIFTAEGAEVYLTRDTIDCLKEQKIKINDYKCGAYEGISLDDETAASTVVSYFKDGLFSSSGKFGSSISLEERRKMAPPIKKFVDAIKKRNIWFNNSKTTLPNNYIERKLAKTRELYYDERVENEVLQLLTETKGKLVFLVDGPGMGKSSVLTKLEIDMRDKEVLSPRIIVRNNLNKFCRTLRDIINQELTLDSFIKQFTSCIPLEELKTRCDFERVPVYILLDGLDEVLPHYKDAMLKILRLLLNHTDVENKLYVQKVVLTTRPHLSTLIEKEFQVESYSLCPIEKSEQLNYIREELKGTNISADEAMKKIEILPAGVQELMANPLMLHILSQIFMDNTSGDVSDIYSLYSVFVERKHELYLYEKQGADPATPDTMWRKNYFVSTTLTFYNYIAIEELLDQKILERILCIDGARNIIKRPINDNMEEVLSYGMVVLENRKLQFKHRSFAEYFYAKIIVGTTCKNIRNSIFGFGYKKGNLIATFLACKLPNKAICNVVHKGWTEFVPEGASLATYQDEHGFLVDHILENTINYAKACFGKNQLLVADLYTQKLFFRWLNEKVEEDKKKWLEQILFHDNMSDVIAALVFSEDLAIQKFVQTWWPPGFGEEKIKQLVRKCSSLIVIAARKEYTQRSSYGLYTDSLYERMSRWLSCEDLKKCARECFGNNNETARRGAFSDPDFSSFIASALSKDELINLFSNDEAQFYNDVGKLRLDDIRRSFGEEFIPTNLLRFRYKSGELKGKSLFVSKHDVHLDLLDRVWSEIEENVDDAVQVILNDEDFHLVNILEEDIRRREMNRKCCPYQSQTSKCQMYLIERSHRIKLLKDVLTRVDYTFFCEKKYYLDWKNLCYVIAYGKLHLAKWEEVLAEKRLEDNIFNFDNGLISKRGQLTIFDLNKVFGLLLLLAFNIQNCEEKHKILTRAPFELVVKCLRSNNQALEREDLFMHILTRLSKNDLCQLSRKKTDDPYLLSELPNVWEVMFLPNGPFHRTDLKIKDLVTTLAAKKIIGGIQDAVFTYSLSCCSVGSVLRGIRYEFNRISGEDVFKTFLEREGNFGMVFSGIEWSVYGRSSSVTHCLFSELVRFCLDVLEGRWEWVKRVAEQNLTYIMPGEKIECLELVSYLEHMALTKINAEDTLHIRRTLNISLFESMFSNFHWNRPCEYYRLLNMLPEYKQKVPSDYEKQTEVHSNFVTCLFHVWIEMFGDDETRRQADRKSQSFNTWRFIHESTDNAELLHIAVQVGSLRGVKGNAWPGLLSWKDKKNGQTALEKAQEKWGSNHEITRFLKRRLENIFHSGCTDHRECPAHEFGDHSDKNVLNRRREVE